MILFEDANRKRNITMYDADFGDCFLIKEANESLLVDCGTLSSTKSPFILNTKVNIANDITHAYKSDLLIAHFHKDHYAMLNVAPIIKFDKIFIANSYFKLNTVEEMLATLLVKGLLHDDEYEDALKTLLAFPFYRQF